MNMRENLIKVYTKFASNEELLRLLYYRPANNDDNPFSPSKENVLDKPATERWKIIEDVIAKTNNLDGMDEDRKCRILVYLSNRNSDRGNYWVSNQDLVIDVAVHRDFDDKDFRLAWICDKVNEILFNNHVDSMGKLKFSGGNPLNGFPNGYVGYRLTYSFTNTN